MRRELKKWVKNLLIIINLIMFLIMASECENLTLFFISHLIAATVFCINSYILIKNMK